MRTPTVLSLVAAAACSSTASPRDPGVPPDAVAFTCPERPDAFPFADRWVTVTPAGRPSLRLRYVETGAGDDVFVLVHGIPASSYLWRNVIPGLAEVGRVVAMDLPGFGRSERPAASLPIDGHADYLAAFLDARGLDRVILVVHDLGSVAGLIEASRHPERVKGVVLLEALIPSTIPASVTQSPSRCTAAQPDAPACFWLFLRSPAGQAAIRDQNLFVEGALGGDPFCPPTPGAMAEYRAAFPDPASREYLMPYPATVPVDGDPATLQPLLDGYTRWLETSPVPKLVVHARPGFLITPAVAEYARATFPGTEVADIGPGFHFLQETNPRGIADAIAAWYRRRVAL